MNETQLQREIQADLQQAGRQVIYLEGKTDPSLFFSLLGVANPLDGIHDQVLVKGLKDRGSGRAAVEARVRIAHESGYRGVYGVVDGDGRDLRALAAKYDAPYAGPCFSWKAYCIENLIVKAGWPPAWGAPPDWSAVLRELVPYAALNTLHRELQGAMDQLGVARFTNPDYGANLKTAPEVSAQLAQYKHLIDGQDLETKFNATVEGYETQIAASLDAGQTLINGKWLLGRYLPQQTGRSATVCKQDLTAHIAANGGFAEVRGLWQRIIGRAP